MKLEHRLTVLTAGLTASTIAACLFTAFWFVKRTAALELDELVVDGANAIAMVVAEHQGDIVPTEAMNIALPDQVVRTVHHVAVFDERGLRVAKSPQFEGVPNTLAELTAEKRPPKPGRTFDLHVPSGLMRAVLTVPTKKPELRILHVVPRGPMDASIDEQRDVFLVLFGSSLAMVILGARWLGRRLAADVNHVTEVARRVGAGELSARAGTTRLNSPETRNLATELNKMIAELLTLLTSQRNFISYAAHELRSPLAALQGELQLALRRVRSPESYVETLGLALTEVQALTQLAEDLLTLARAQAHPRNGSTSSIDEVIDDAIRLVQGAAQIKEVEIVLRVDAVRGVNVVGGRSDLARALRNLLENGIKFGPRQGRVELEGLPHERFVSLSIRDEGPGVPARDIDSLFQPFFRGTSRTAAITAGTGLGLAITREIASNAGGSVEFVEGQEKGAAFRLRLAIAGR